MSKRLLFLGLLTLFSIGFITACQAGTSSDNGDSENPSLVVTIQQNSKRINLATKAELVQTIQIDMLRREGRDESTPVYFEELFAITDDETIHTIVEALDKDLDLKPRSRCPALYTLVFHLRNGQQHEFGYACEMASPSFMRGGQSYWQGKDVIAPDAFNRAVSERLNEAGILEILFQE